MNRYVLAAPICALALVGAATGVASAQETPVSPECLDASLRVEVLAGQAVAAAAPIVTSVVQLTEAKAALVNATAALTAATDALQEDPTEDNEAAVTDAEVKVKVAAEALASLVPPSEDHRDALLTAKTRLQAAITARVEACTADPVPTVEPPSPTTVIPPPSVSPTTVPPADGDSPVPGVDSGSGAGSSSGGVSQVPSGSIDSGFAPR